MIKSAASRDAESGIADLSAASPYLAVQESSLLTPDRRGQLTRWYEQMVLIRQFETAAAEMYTRAKIGGYLHLNIGEEATIVGAIDALQPQDYVVSNYREHGHALARGMLPESAMAELFGKETGCSKGRGGSMHLFDLKRHFMGGYGIVGGSLPLAVGYGYAIRYRQEDGVVMALFGEGATNIGAFHESLNLASLWKLPIVFVCVNNFYAMGMRVDQDSAVTEIWRKAYAYDMAAERVDGMDILAVHEATQRAVGLARQTHQPTLLESVTYRYRGHSMADPGRYRPPAEVEEWRKRDPILRFRQELGRAGLLTDAEATKIDESVDRIIANAVKFAEDSPFPPVTALYEYVYCTAESGKEG